MKNVKRINESQLRAIVTESVKKVLREDLIDGLGYDCGIDYDGGYSPTPQGLIDDILDENQAIHGEVHKIFQCIARNDIEDVREHLNMIRNATCSIKDRGENLKMIIEDDYSQTEEC